MKSLIYLFLIAIATYIAYIPAGKAKFTNWDDDGYVTENKDISSFSKNKANLLTKSYVGNYHPLTMLSFAIDYSIGKLKPKVYHRTSIILHLINAILVFWLILLLTNKPEIGLICGMLFGIHPLHVESVAWISERKNVLYAFFFLASLIGYLKYIKKAESKYYFLALFLFLLSALSKATAVSLTITLILIDFIWDRKLLDKKILLEKIPFLVISILFGIIALYTQPLRLEEIESLRAEPLNNPFYERILYAVFNICQYCIQLLAPYKLAAFYPYPEKVNGVLPLEYYVVPSLIMIALVAIVFLLIKRNSSNSKFILFGIIFFLINIALVLQLIPVGDAIRADRYTYIPSIGIFLLIGISYKYILESHAQFKYGFLIVVTGFCFSMAYLTHERCKVWHDSISLWTDEIEKFPNLAFAYYQRGVEREVSNDTESAIKDYQKAIEANPKYYRAYNNKGAIEYKKGNFDLAIQDFDKTILFHPNSTEGYKNRGKAKYRSKDFKGSIEDLTIYLKSNPTDYSVLMNRGIAEHDLKNYSKALEDFNKVIELAPNFGGGYSNRGLTNFVLKDYDRALIDFNKALELDPSYPIANYLRAQIKIMKGLIKDACPDLIRALNSGYRLAEEDVKKYCGK